MCTASSQIQHHSSLTEQTHSVCVYAHVGVGVSGLQAEGRVGSITDRECDSELNLCSLCSGCFHKNCPSGDTALYGRKEMK